MSDAGHRVLVSCPLIADAMGRFDDRLADHGIAYDVVEVDQQLTEAQLLDLLDGYEAILAGDDELTGRVLRSTDDLQLVVKWGIGTDNIDEVAAERLGIEVRNTPGAFADEVADVVIGYTVSLARRLHEIDRAVRSGEWHTPRGRSLSGLTMGVIGVGSIGSEVVRRGHALGMDVLGADVVSLPDELIEETGVEHTEREALFDRADVVSLNCVLTHETEGMVGAAELERLGPDGYLINTARGGLIDEDALVEALRADALAGAALDVLGTEPLPPDHPLTTFDDVILGSHNAQNTHEAVARVNERAVVQIVGGLD